MGLQGWKKRVKGYLATWGDHYGIRMDPTDIVYTAQVVGLVGVLISKLLDRLTPSQRLDFRPTAPKRPTNIFSIL